MSNITIGFTVDWIAATFKNEADGMSFVRSLHRQEFHMVEAVPPRGYTAAYELESGLVMAWNEVRDSMGFHVQLSGSVLRWYQKQSFGWYTLLSKIKSYSGRTSRVDLAIDVKNGGLKQADFVKSELKPYEGRGRTPKLLPVGTQEEGWTAYVGSRKSEKYLRIYDKAKEQKDFASDYVRVELECKGTVAHAVGHEFPNLTMDLCAAMARTLIRTVADFKHPSWAEAMQSETVALTLPEGRARNTLGWLVDVCAPALAKEIARHPSDDVLSKFVEALEKALEGRGLSLD